MSPSSSLVQDTGLSRRQQGFKSPWRRFLQFYFFIRKRVMETYLPAPFNFLCWEEIKKSFQKKKSFFPKCVELNITGRDYSRNYFENEIDIFTIERVLKELNEIGIDWLVLGRKNEIFLHKSIKSFFKLLKYFNLKIFSLKTNGVYLNRVDIGLIFDLVRENLFIKKDKNLKIYQDELLKENLKNIISYRNKNNLFKPNLYLFEEDFEKEEIKLLSKMGFIFLEYFQFCQPELSNYLPFFFLSIDKNGFCYSGETFSKPFSTIFFNSIKKIWSSKNMREIRKNISIDDKIKFLNKNFKEVPDLKV